MLLKNQTELTIFKITTDIDGIVRTPKQKNSDVLDCKRIKVMDEEPLIRLKSILPSKSMAYLRVSNELMTRNLPRIMCSHYIHSNGIIDDNFSHFIPIIDVNAYEEVHGEYYPEGGDKQTSH